MNKTTKWLLAGLALVPLLLLPLALHAQEATRKDEGNPASGSERGGEERLDLKRVGKRYRLKVVSAGVPTLGGYLEGYSVRTQYRVFNADKAGKLVGIGYLNDYVYVEEPGDYVIEVNGGVVGDTFEIPPEMTRDRIEASWKRARAVELRPKNGKGRLSVPSIWVLHPPEVVGVHNDDYTVDPTGETAQLLGKGSHAKGVAVVYPPEEIHDIDDGILFSNTLVHLLPGKYALTINNTVHTFELAPGETKLIRLGALIVHQDPPAGVAVAQTIAQVVSLTPATRLTSTDTSTVNVPGLGKWFVVAPGKYGEIKRDDGSNWKELCEIPPGGKGALYPVQQAFAKPRLGLNAQDNKTGGVVVRAVTDGGPAAAAGVKVGDVIVAADGKDLAKTADLVKIVGEKKPGDEVALTIKREGASDPVAVKVKLGGD
jgi:hypothetical protein